MNEYENSYWLIADFLNHINETQTESSGIWETQQYPHCDFLKIQDDPNY